MTAGEHTTKTTLEVMLQQEAVYYTSTSRHATCFNQSVSALEKVHKLCQLRHRDTIVIAASFLSRYLQTKLTTLTPAMVVRRSSLVCFYMAVKIHEPAALPLRTLPDLYRRFLAHDDDDDTDPSGWEKMELDVCMALQWRLHPPLAMAFCDRFLESSSPRRLRKRALSTLETAFSTNPLAYINEHRASSLAMAALVLAEQRETSVLGTSDALGRALAFLRPTQPRHSSITPPSTPLSKRNRKRCVTPTPDDERMRKRLKPCTIKPLPSSIFKASLLNPIPTLLWTGSPRSTFSMTDDELY